MAGCYLAVMGQNKKIKNENESGPTFMGPIPKVCKQAKEKSIVTKGTIPIRAKITYWEDGDTDIDDDPKWTHPIQMIDIQKHPI